MVAVTVCGATGLALSAWARKAADGPDLSFRVPGEAAAGARVVAQGRVSGVDGRSAVRAELKAAHGWHTLARGAVADGRFRVPLRLPAAGATATLRGAVLVGGRKVAVSAPTVVRLSGATARRLVPPSPSAGASIAPAPASAPATPPVTPEPPAIPADSAYWGAWIDPGTSEQPSPVNAERIGAFETIAGKPPSLLESYSAWSQCTGETCSRTYEFPEAQLQEIRDRGAIPLFSWASESSSGEVSQPKFQLADIIAGTYDQYVERWATAAREWGHPFFLRFDWEMNGNWFPWGNGVNGNAPGEYAEAWRHVHDIFTRVGATNAAWVWCPFVSPKASAAFYPGDAYVDWTCLDGYNNTKTSAWRSFKQIFTPSYQAITAPAPEGIAPAKPMLLAEFASSEAGAPAGSSKGQWITQAFEALPTEFPAVRGLMWFDYEENGKGWPLETSKSAEAAFAAAIAAPRYLSNAFASLAAPIPVP